MKNLTELLEMLLGQRYDSFVEDGLNVDVFEMDAEIYEKLLKAWENPETRALLQSLGIVSIADHYDGYEKGEK